MNNDIVKEGKDFTVTQHETIPHGTIPKNANRIKSDYAAEVSQYIKERMTQHYFRSMYAAHTTMFLSGSTATIEEDNIDMRPPDPAPQLAPVQISMSMEDFQLIRHAAAVVVAHPHRALTRIAEVLNKYEYGDL